MAFSTARLLRLWQHLTALLSPMVEVLMPSHQTLFHTHLQSVQCLFFSRWEVSDTEIVNIAIFIASKFIDLILIQLCTGIISYIFWFVAAFQVKALQVLVLSHSTSKGVGAGSLAMLVMQHTKGLPANY